jgi:hypothetical protein
VGPITIILSLPINAKAAFCRFSALATPYCRTSSLPNKKAKS